MDGLCQLTVERAKEICLPAPDYDDFIEVRHRSRDMLPREVKGLNKDILTRSKEDILNRPQFLSQQHKMRAAAAKKQEEKEREESNELLLKLKSRSQQLEQNEKEENQKLPEFATIKLKANS